MKKMILFLLCVSGQIVASPLAALEQAKQDLIAGKQKVTAGKEQVQAGYWKIKHDAVDPLTASYDDMQSTICVVTTIDKYAGDIVIAMGVLSPTLPFGVVATPGLIAMAGVPEVIKAIKNVLNAISNTLGNVQGTINASNEKMNPGTLLAFAQSAAGTTAQINTIIANNTDKLKPDFVANVTNITAQLNKIIDLVKSKADPSTGLFKPDVDTSPVGVAASNISGALGKLPLGAGQQAAPASRDKGLFDSYQVDLSKAYATLSATNYGRSTRLGQDKLGCPIMGTDPATGKVMDNAPSADQSKDNKDSHPWADARGYIVVPIFDLLAQVSPTAWNAASTVSLAPMYQQFALAEQKFDQAIAKLDKIITDFKAALAVLEDDGS